MENEFEFWLKQEPTEPPFYTEEESELTDSQKWYYYEHLFR